MLRINDIDVCYGKTQVLFEVSLHVNEGETVIILGTNGAGKTTTLKSISGLCKLAGGSIEFLGKRIDSIDRSEIVSMGLCHCPENRRVFRGMSVEKNLRIGAYVRKDKKEIKEDLLRMYDLFPVLMERKRQMAGSLSGGEQQMLAIGRALMGQPKLLVLDEPSLGLAPLIVSEVGKLVGRINNDGVTILLVEQNAKIALSVARRGYVMDRGKITISGSSDDLKSRPEVIESYLGG